MANVEARKTRGGETRYYDRGGKRLSATEAHRREKISSYAKRRVRTEAGTYGKKKVVVVARARKAEGKRQYYKRGPRAGQEKYVTVTAEVEVDTEDPTEEEILAALNEENPDLVHFSVAGSEEAE